MAEPVSSIITIATVSLDIIKETVKFIKEVYYIDKHIDRLLVELKDVHGLIKIVQATYQRADHGEHIKPSIYVGKCLVKCKDRLAEMKSVIIGLASRDTDGIFRKVALKRQSDAVKKDLQFKTDEVHRYLRYINTAIHCWNLDVNTDNQRRLSVATAAVGGCNLSNPESLFRHETILAVRRASIATTDTAHSRHSLSSTSSRVFPVLSADCDGLLPSQAHCSTQQNSDWQEFHFQITKAPINNIEAILRQHPEPRTLTRSVDGLRRTPLHLAAQRGDIKLAQVLLDFGADINAKDSEPATILDFAIAFNNSEFVAFLIERGVDESAILNRNRSKFSEMRRIIIFKREMARTTEKGSRISSWGRRKDSAT
ncbi:hypothetical protein ACN47E_006453 [Coniothyrium glycines]